MNSIFSKIVNCLSKQSQKNQLKIFFHEHGYFHNNMLPSINKERRTLTAVYNEGM